MTQTASKARRPLWFLWSLATIALWGVWGLVSKVASSGVDPWANQVLFAGGVLPLLVLFFFRTRAECAAAAADPAVAQRRRAGAGWALLTGILGGVGNIAFFQALGAGGNASVVTPVTALFPMVTVLLALVVLKERLRLVQWAGLALAFAAIYLLSA